jgi:GTPase SAR1 family protein
MINKSFFGRKICLELLEKRISSLKDGYRQNIAIVGDELVGKTSIILKFLNQFCDTKIITIYLEIRHETLVSFARRFIAILLYNFLINSDMQLKEDLDFLIKKSQKYIPKTTERIKSILNSLTKRKKNNIYTELLSLCEIIHQETGKSCVVIFDEFQNLEFMGIRSLYREWSKLLITHKNTLYIIISSRKFKTNQILSRDLSLLFGNFEVIAVEPFDIKTCEKYLECKLKGLNLNTGLKNFMVHFTGGYPLYLEIITGALLKSNQAQLVDILENLLFDSTGLLNQRFSNYIKRFLDLAYSNDYISILYLISSGRNKIKEIAHILQKQKKELMLRINHLLEFDAIARNGDFLKINDRVFGFWLRFVYQEKLESLTFDAKKQKDLFRNKIEGMIQEFLLNAQKPIIERVAELLRLFENDSMQIERRRLRLNRFREIKPLEFNNRGALKEGLIGRSNESLWIMAFKPDPLTEEDITEFAKECKRYRSKLQKKIIVTLQDIDANTRLRALEEKILTWDINSLNQILDLFSKPRVIV